MRGDDLAGAASLQHLVGAELAKLPQRASRRVRHATSKGPGAIVLRGQAREDMLLVAKVALTSINPVEAPHAFATGVARDTFILEGG